MRASIVIPSYWGRSSGESFNKNDAVYDHPTPLDFEGTLGRALQSISLLTNRDFNVVVLACATSPDIEHLVEEKVRAIAAPYETFFPLAVVSHSVEKGMRDYVAGQQKEGKALDPALISLTGYSNIRNMCLIVSELARSEVAVLFDDDQVYEDAAYLDKVFEDIDGKHEGKPVRAVAGYYLQQDGGYLVPPPTDWWMSEWPMVTAMNQAFSIIGSEPRLKLTPFVFGGNMALHRDVFHKIAFDPHVRRGEDIDYLVNCKFFDIDFLLDNQLAIKHLPPESHIPAWAHFRENIYRFVYAREKLRRQVPVEGLRRVEVAELDPYPGRCMRDDLEDLIYKTSVLMGLSCLHGALGVKPGMKAGMREETEFQESMNNIQLARFDAQPQQDPFRSYLELRSAWEELMKFLASDETLARELQAAF